MRTKKQQQKNRKLNNNFNVCFDDDLISMNFFFFFCCLNNHQKKTRSNDAYAKTNVLITFNVIMICNGGQINREANFREIFERAFPSEWKCSINVPFFRRVGGKCMRFFSQAHKRWSKHAHVLSLVSLIIRIVFIFRIKWE